MGEELWQALKMERAIRDQKYPDCPWVFHREGKTILDFRDPWDNACKAVGLWDGDNKTGRPTKLFHDLRRTGVRNLVRAGAPERVAMAISGHKTRAVFDRYNIVSEGDLKDAVRRLDSYIDERKKSEPGAQPESWHTIGTQDSLKPSKRDEPRVV